MKALAVIPKKESSLHLRETENPVPARGEVLVRSLEAAIDATDHEINAGHYGEAPEGEDFLILGHESVGEVISAEGIEALSPGDRVVPTVRRPDGCPNCARGEADMCLWGGYRERGIKGLHGFAADYYTEHPGDLVKVPENLRSIAILVEPLSIVEKVIRQIETIQRRMHWAPARALILGAGPIGLLAMILCRLRGMETFLFDQVPRDALKARLVEASGAAYLTSQEEALVDLPKRLGNFEVVIEATGHSRVAVDALSVVGTNGALCLIGIFGPGRKEMVEADRLTRLVLGNGLVFGSVNAHRIDFERAVVDLEEIARRWPGWPERLITRRLPLERFQEGFVKEKEEIKTVLEFVRGDERNEPPFPAGDEHGG